MFKKAEECLGVIAHKKDKVGKAVSSKRHIRRARFRDFPRGSINHTLLARPQLLVFIFDG